MRKKRKLAVYQSAVELASSGKYDGWREIQKELVKKGHSLAPELLGGGRIRTVLDLHCAHSQKTRKSG
jgi:hypothetical protein